MAERYAERRALEAEMRLSMDAGGFHVECTSRRSILFTPITGFKTATCPLASSDAWRCPAVAVHPNR